MAANTKKGGLKQLMKDFEKEDIARIYLELQRRTDKAPNKSFTGSTPQPKVNGKRNFINDLLNTFHLL